MLYLEDGNKETCYGCRACEEVCPVSCISMREDEEGFVYPYTDPAKCIHCDKCKRVCPESYADFSDTKDITAFAAINLDSATVSSCSSGGVFPALCEKLISDGYRVYGAVMTEDLKVRHEEACDIGGCERFRRSKYVQSDMAGCFEKVAAILKAKGKAAFSSVPCQCAALKLYLKEKGIDTNGLMLISLLCHGAPSQKLFDRYICEAEKKYKKNISGYRFRCKDEHKGRKDLRAARIVFDDGSSQYITGKDDPYLKGYYSRLFLRPSCGHCIFARPERVGDITIADSWGLKPEFPPGKEKNGSSLVLCVSDKGKKLYTSCEKELISIPVEKELALNAQKVMREPVYMHENRKRFFELVSQKGFYAAVRIATVPPLKRVINILVKDGKRKIQKFFGRGKR